MTRLAKIRLSDEEERIVCREMEALDGLLRRVSEASRADIKPLYHVWEISGWSRSGGEPEPARLDYFIGRDRLDGEGRVRVPWRGLR